MSSQWRYCIGPIKVNEEEKSNFWKNSLIWEVSCKSYKNTPRIFYNESEQEDHKERRFEGKIVESCAAFRTDLSYSNWTFLSSRPEAFLLRKLYQEKISELSSLADVPARVGAFEVWRFIKQSRIVRSASAEVTSPDSLCLAIMMCQASSRRSRARIDFFSASCPSSSQPRPRSERPDWDGRLAAAGAGRAVCDCCLNTDSQS